MTPAAILSLLVSWLAGCPSDPLDRARRLEAQGQTVEAGDAYLAAAKADPALLAAWAGAVRVFCRERADVGRCLAVLDYEMDLLGPVEAHTAALAEALEDRARARLEKGLVKAARSDLDRAEKVAPDRASLHAAFAKLLLAIGRPEAARGRLERARDLDPNLPEIEQLWRATVTETPTSAYGAPGPAPSESSLPAFGR